MAHPELSAVTTPLIECVMMFDYPGREQALYLVKGVLGPAPYAASANVCRVVGSGYDQPEVVTADAGNLTQLLGRVETILSDRHAGARLTITFDFTKSW